MPSLFSPLAGLQARWAVLRTDLHEMLALRLDLLRLELRVAARQLTWLAIFVSFFGVLAVAGVSVLAVLTADELQTCLAWTKLQAYLAVGVGLLLLGALGIFAALKIFRRRFTGLQTSIAELQEDLLWLEEFRSRG